MSAGYILLWSSQGRIVPIVLFRESPASQGCIQLSVPATYAEFVLSLPVVRPCAQRVVPPLEPHQVVPFLRRELGRHSIDVSLADISGKYQLFVFYRHAKTVNSEMTTMTSLNQCHVFIVSESDTNPAEERPHVCRSPGRCLRQRKESVSRPQSPQPEIESPSAERRCITNL